MTRPVEPYTCAAECGRRFGSLWSIERHRARGRCKSDRALKRLGLRMDGKGIWRRHSPVGEQAKLPGIRVPRAPGARRSSPGLSVPVEADSGLPDRPRTGIRAPETAVA